MCIYAKIGTNEMQVGGRHPGEGWVAVTELRPGEHYTASSDGAWVLDTNLLADDIRAERDRLLAECDWTQMPDAPLDDEARRAWAVYRQALRDVPQQTGFPNSVTWPNKPE